MKTKKRSYRGGFSFLELVMTLAITSMIMYVIFVVLRTGDVQIRTAQTKMTIQDSVREGLYKMQQEIRQSSPTRVCLSTVQPCTTTSTSIEVWVPDPNNPIDTNTFQIDWAQAHRIQYTLGGLNNRQILRNDLTSNQTSVVANDVTSLNFIGDAQQPNLVTINVGVQRALSNGRLVPVTPLQMSGQAEIRNA
jgi:type II secretory pathway pseudopilin PulG